MVSPKQAFQKSSYFKDFGTYIDTDAMQAGLMAALLQYQMNNPESTNPEISHAIQQRIIGAREFVGVLTRIHLAEVKTPSSINQNLDYKA